MDGEKDLIFRTMKAAHDGLPELGRTRRTLGVKVCPLGIKPADLAEFDIYPDSQNRVAPGGGMSVAVGDPRGLPKHRRPRALGGEGRDPLFELRVSAVPMAVRVTEDHPPHAFIEPASLCPLGDYEAALATTRPDWKARNV